LHKDQDLIRNALLDLYTNQIMDNLVRAANGMPIIQLDYSNASAQVTITNSISGSDSQATTVSNVLTLPASTLMATRSILTTLMGGGMSSNGNQVSLLATPVTTMNEVYDAYLEFLDSTRNPGSLMVSDCRPKPGMAHIWKKYNGKYFWVPISYRDAFFKLALITTAQRGKSLLPAPEYFTVNVIDTVGDPQPGARPGTSVVTVKLDQKLPADDLGYMTLDKDNTHTQFFLDPVSTSPPGAVPQPTDVFKIGILDTKRPLFMNLRAAPQPARVFLVHNRPKPPTIEDLISRVNFQLQQIQFNQNRGLGL
jgi:hypothetical protein